jgi:hypothetical protein
MYFIFCKLINDSSFIDVLFHEQVNYKPKWYKAGVWRLQRVKRNNVIGSFTSSKEERWNQHEVQEYRCIIGIRRPIRCKYKEK